MDKQHAGIGHGLVQAGYAGDSAKPANAFDSLASAVSQLRDMQERVQCVADRLTGNAPPTASAGAKLQEIGGGGLIDGVDRQATAILEIICGVYASLSRIENRL